MRTRSRQRVTKTEAVADNGMVTAMHPLAAEAGCEILERGGNAADGAIAAALAVGVVEPFMSGLGGALYALAHDAESGATTSFDGSVVVPREAREDMFELAPADGPRLGVYGWPATKGDASETGFRSIGVPGALPALAELHERLATMSWDELVAPALGLAEEGFPVDDYYFVQSAASASRLRPFPATMHVFYRPDGTARVPGSYGGSDRLRQPALAGTLRSLAAEGPRSFYEGRLARETVSHVRANGGILSLEDFEHYRTISGEPVRVSYRDHDLELLPGPSGSPTVALALGILEGFDLAGMAESSVSRLHLVAEAIRVGFQDRFELLADPLVEDVPLEAFFSKDYAAERRRLISEGGRRREELPRPDPWRHAGRRPRRAREGAGDASSQHTTHLNVVDGKGNVVSLTATLGARFGSGTIVPENGVVLNNGMMWFDPVPGRLNSIRPEKRALHAATPTLVFRRGQLRFALGSPGARKIMSAVLQVLLNLIDHGSGIQDAVQAPRIHTETNPPLLVEAHFPEAVPAGLRDRGHEVAVIEDSFFGSYFGRPSGIYIDREGGCLRGGVDPYRVGIAVGF